MHDCFEHVEVSPPPSRLCTKSQPYFMQALCQIRISNGICSLARPKSIPSSGSRNRNLISCILQVSSTLIFPGNSSQVVCNGLHELVVNARACFFYRSKGEEL